MTSMNHLLTKTYLRFHSQEFSFGKIKKLSSFILIKWRIIIVLLNYKKKRNLMFKKHMMEFHLLKIHMSNLLSTHGFLKTRAQFSISKKQIL